MLAKKNRLPINLFIGKRGKLAKSPSFLVKIFLPETPEARFGVTVSTKVAKAASKRNQLKRMVYNLIRTNRREIPHKDYWITLLPKVATISNEQFKRELLNLLN